MTLALKLLRGSEISFSCCGGKISGFAGVSCLLELLEHCNGGTMEGMFSSLAVSSGGMGAGWMDAGGEAWAFGEHERVRS